MEQELAQNLYFMDALKKTINLFCKSEILLFLEAIQ
jgi:hypothetical protein